MMKRATAAAYCDLTERAFEREIEAGRLPRPVMFGGAPHWSLTQLEDSVAAITGESRDEAGDDWRKGSPLYAAR